MIEYADKDKDATDGITNRFRDVDANEIKNVVNGIIEGDHRRGEWNASSNGAPTTGGSGGSGAIVAWDEWRVSIAASDFLGSGMPLQVGSFIRARVDGPGQSLNDWAII